MKGLLIKDYKLLMLQKRVFLIMCAVAVCMNFYMKDNTGFIIGYLTFFAALVANTTLSYDEYGNGMTFLLTLPVTKKIYVKSKYVGNLLLLLAFWFVSVLLECIFYTVEGDQFFKMENITAVFWVLPVSLVFIDFMLPLVLRFGQEKGKLVWAVIGGILFGIVAFVNAVPADGQNWLEEKVDQMLQHGIILTICIILFSLAGLYISYVCSIKVMEKKQF